MKKIALLLVTFSSIILFSCASDSAENQDDEILDSPATLVSENLQDEDLPSSHLVEPEDFEEPLVRDLEPVEETAVPNITKITTVPELEPYETKEVVITPEENAQTNEPAEKTDLSENKITENKVKEAPKAQNTNTKIDNTKKDTVSLPKENKVSEQKKEEPKNTANNQTKTVEKNETPLVEVEAETINPVNPIMDTEPVKHLPSRSVTVNTNETLTVKYPGYGWIYLGSDSEYNNLVSTGRKIENEETIYTLTAKKPGTQLHHFYKVDSITGEYIDDFLEVNVTDNSGSVYTVVQAPDYKEIIPERAVIPAVSSSKKAPETTASENRVEVKPNEKRNFEVYTPELTDDKEEPVITQKPAAPKEEYIENLDADDLLKKAKELFDEKKYTDSQKYLTSFMEIATKDRDEGLFLQGQIFEQDGKTKNIKEAINSYQSIVDNYPESYYWDDANKRIIYLNRFYIQIR